MCHQFTITAKTSWVVLATTKVRDRCWNPQRKQKPPDKSANWTKWAEIWSQVCPCLLTLSSCWLVELNNTSIFFLFLEMWLCFVNRKEKESRVQLVSECSFVSLWLNFGKFFFSLLITLWSLATFLFCRPCFYRRVQRGGKAIQQRFLTFLNKSPNGHHLSVSFKDLKCNI